MNRLKQLIGLFKNPLYFILLLSCIAFAGGLTLTVVKNYRHEKLVSKIKQDLEKLKVAVQMYYESHDRQYPSNITTDLMNTVPALIHEVYKDPFQTDKLQGTYGYYLGEDKTKTPYFYIYSQGINRISETSFDPEKIQVISSGDDWIVSSLISVKN